DVFAVTPGDTFSVRLRAVGRNYLTKLWRSSSDEPSTWNITYTSVNNPVGGRVAVEAARETGNTNTNPVLTFDNYHIADLANINPQVDDLGTDDVTPLQTAPWLKFP